jgi:hypothetical protein
VRRKDSEGFFGPPARKASAACFGGAAAAAGVVGASCWALAADSIGSDEWHPLVDAVITAATAIGGAVLAAAGVFRLDVTAVAACSRSAPAKPRPDFNGPFAAFVPNAWAVAVRWVVVAAARWVGAHV